MPKKKHGQKKLNLKICRFLKVNTQKRPSPNPNQRKSRNKFLTEFGKKFRNILKKLYGDSVTKGHLFACNFRFDVSIAYISSKVGFLFHLKYFQVFPCYYFRLFFIFAFYDFVVVDYEKKRGQSES